VCNALGSGTARTGTCHGWVGGWHETGREPPVHTRPSPSPRGRPSATPSPSDSHGWAEAPDANASPELADGHDPAGLYTVAHDPVLNQLRDSQSVVPSYCPYCPAWTPLRALLDCCLSWSEPVGAVASVGWDYRL
jgi:hypothetical protein